MKYIRAEDLLPEELVKELQKYAAGNVIYIPKPKQNHRKWGELSGSKEYVYNRNIKIKARHKNGNDIYEIAEDFCLSINSIKKIIYS